MLLVSGILENAARVAPGAVAATLDDRSLTFGQIDAEANRIANALAGEGIGILMISSDLPEALGMRSRYVTT